MSNKILKIKKQRTKWRGGTFAFAQNRDPLLPGIFAFCGFVISGCSRWTAEDCQVSTSTGTIALALVPVPLLLRVLV